MPNIGLSMDFFYISGLRLTRAFLFISFLRSRDFSCPRKGALAVCRILNDLHDLWELDVNHQGIGLIDFNRSKSEKDPYSSYQDRLKDGRCSGTCFYVSHKVTRAWTIGFMKGLSNEHLVAKVFINWFGSFEKFFCSNYVFTTLNSRIVRQWFFRLKWDGSLKTNNYSSNLVPCTSSIPLYRLIVIHGSPVKRTTRLSLKRSSHSERWLLASNRWAWSKFH